MYTLHLIRSLYIGTQMARFEDIIHGNRFFFYSANYTSLHLALADTFSPSPSFSRIIFFLPRKSHKNLSAYHATRHPPSDTSRSPVFPSRAFCLRRGGSRGQLTPALRHLAKHARVARFRYVFFSAIGTILASGSHPVYFRVHKAHISQWPFRYRLLFYAGAHNLYTIITRVFIITSARTYTHIHFTCVLRSNQERLMTIYALKCSLTLLK